VLPMFCPLTPWMILAREEERFRKRRDADADGGWRSLPTRTRTDWSTNIIGRGKERHRTHYLESIIACSSSLSRPGGLRYETAWALNAAAAEANDIQVSENIGANDIERAVKIPSKFKPYPLQITSLG
jgi:hypothetical protein